MRAWILTAVVLAGCLHGPAPKLSAQETAEKEWKAQYLAGRYEKAAETAWRGKLHPVFIRGSFERVRNLARARTDGFHGDYTTDNATLKARIHDAYAQEVAIACKYARQTDAPAQAYKDVYYGYELLFEESLLYLLLDNDCPLSHLSRYQIIAVAARYPTSAKYALEQALKSNWNDADKRAFVGLYTQSYDCERGFKAAARLNIGKADMAELIRESSCEKGPIDTRGWDFSLEDMREHFFAAVRARKYHLALEFNRLAKGGLDGLRYVAERMLAQHDEYQEDLFFRIHPEFRDQLYEYALANGRGRFVGLQAKDIRLQERAFDALMAGGKYEDAAEVAELGISQTLRTEGVLKAFRAAVAAGNFPSARYLWKRYPQIVPEEEVEKARSAWNKANIKDKRFRRSLKKRKKPKSPECQAAKPGEWTVERCD